ncbi:MAG: hypothetical protein ACI9UU_003102 [Candidatus Azotimanducaceae bacterium]|jgi:hypothetical protein
MSSAYSITHAVNPPRAVYLDFPLGHTAGKPQDRHQQLEIMRDTFAAFSTISTPGEIQHLKYEWHSDHGWKDRVMRPTPLSEKEEKDATDDKADIEQEDSRVARHASPQYQSQQDEALADAACPTCVFLDQIP